MRVQAVIQARTGSSRLPGKVLEQLGGRSLLGWAIRAAQQATQVDEVIVATTPSTADDEVAELGRHAGAVVFRGSEHDVLARFAGAVRAHPAEAVVRLTADCPLLDPALIDRVVCAWRAAPQTDYVSTTLVRTLPRGLDVELVRVPTLLDLDATAAGADRVHVTSGLYTGEGPTRHDLLGLVVAPRADDLRVTVDTPEDLAVVRTVVEALGDTPPSWRAVVAFLRAHPHVAERNAHVVQKPLGEG